MFLTKSFSILEELPHDNSSVIELFTPETVTTDEETFNYSALLESLRLHIEVNSLAVPTVPAGLEDLGRVEALEAYKQYQWESERFHLNLLRKKSGDWIKIGTVPLISRRPFYKLDLLPQLTRQVAARIAHGDALGVQFENAGYGLPAAADRIVVHGEGLQELDVPGSLGGSGVDVEALRETETQPIALEPGWSVIGESAHGPVVAEKNILGEVRFTGSVSIGSRPESGAKIGTIPEGFRPDFSKSFPVLGLELGIIVVIEPNGDLKIVYDGSLSYAVAGVNLTNISYRTPSTV